MKRNSLIIIFVSSLLLIFLVLSCTSPVEPIRIIEPRELVWEVDTIYAVEFGEPTLQTWMSAIWASGPYDVYIVGHNTAVIGGNSGKGYHFDGESWKNLPLYGRITLNDITGFSTDNILTVGYRWSDNQNSSRALALQYNGNTWQEHNLSDALELQAIGANSPDNIWAGGWGISIWNYNGTTWKNEQLPVSVPVEDHLGLNSIAVNRQGIVYANLYYYENEYARMTRFLINRDKHGWGVIDTAITEPGRHDIKWGYSDLWFSPGGTLYSVGHGVFRWNGASWERIFEGETGLSGIYGTHDSNIFVVGNFGKVYHFNGSEWYSFDEFRDDNIVFGDVWTDGEHVFIVGRTVSFPIKTVVLRGKIPSQ